jgi:hypothetical protein
MRNILLAESVGETLDKILEDLKNALAGLRRPTALAAAEEALIAARGERAAAADHYRLACRENGKRNAPSSGLEAAVRSTKAALAAADARVARAQQALDGRREEHGGTIAATVATFRHAAAAAVAGAAEILSMTEAVAAAEHVSLPDVVPYGPAIEGLIAAAHRASWREKNRGERAVSAAGAAISARRYEPPKIPTSWKGKLSDVVTGGVAENYDPVPIREGSNSTSQKIPPAALDRGMLRKS